MKWNRLILNELYSYFVNDATFMKKKIYIIGDTKVIDENVKKKFSFAELKLKEMGFEVYNPIDEKNNPYKSKKSNLKRLLDSDAVFLLSSAILDKRRNLELNLAFELDLLMIHDFLVVD